MELENWFVPFVEEWNIPLVQDEILEPDPDVEAWLSGSLLDAPALSGTQALPDQASQEEGFEAEW